MQQMGCSENYNRVFFMQVLTNLADPPQTASGSITVNSGKDIFVVKSTARTGPTDRRKQMSKTWQITGPGITETQLSNSAIFPFGFNTDILMVNLNTSPNFFVPGTSYTVTMSVNNGAMVGQSSLSFFVNLPPSNGICFGASKVGTHLKVC
jgi:hypothetical protein